MKFWMVILSFAMVCSLGYADIGIVPIDSVEVASSLVKHELDHYEGGFYATWVGPDQSETPLESSFTLDKSRMVTSLVINGKDIECPRAGLKIPKGEGRIAYFWLYLKGVDVNGEVFETGTFYEESFVSPYRIQVNLKPSPEHSFLPYAVDGDPSQLGIRLTSTQGWGWYDSQMGGWQVYYFPYAGVISYEIYNTVSGEIIERGEVGKEPSGDVVVNVGYEGQVIDLFPGQDSFSHRQQWFDGYTGGEYAKVGMGRLDGRRFSISVFGEGQPAYVRLQVWGINGEERILFEDQTGYDPDYYNFPEGYEGVIVSITPASDKVPYFTVYASRFWDGGGKG